MATDDEVNDDGNGRMDKDDDDNGNNATGDGSMGYDDKTMSLGDDNEDDDDDDEVDDDGNDDDYGDGARGDGVTRYNEDDDGDG